MDSNNLDVLITDYISSDIGEDDYQFYSSKLAILDTIGCIIEASNHENVLQFASKNNLSLNFKNPFKNLSVNESYENISWYLTVLTRWFDYNDTFLAKEWAHPSDNFGSIYSYFYKNKNYKFNDFTNALTKAYEIQGSLCLGTSLNKLGYDHVFYVKLASGSVFSYLVNNGDTNAVRRTVNNILLDGPSLRAYRHFPNVGKRKSWAAADASRRGIELAIISSYKDEIYESVQNENKWGFESSFLDNSKIEFGKDLNNWVIQNILFKVLFPAEFHGQSAVEAAIELSKEFNKNINKFEKVNIYTHEPAMRIISNKEVLKNASDRDHSMEYMVAAALLYGELKYEMYEESFEGFENINNLRKKIFVSEQPQFTKDYYEFSKRYISNSIEIVYKDNSTSEKITIENPIGHPSRREEAIPLLKDKFLRNVESLFDTEKAIEVWDKIINIEKDDDLNKFLIFLMKMNEIYLLVGGEATRLQPLSSGIPKALLTIRGERIIDKIIKQFSNLENFNFNLICSVKHEEHWKNYKTNHNNNVNLHFEKSKLDTAGYIIENLDSMPDRFYCMNGDLLLNVDLSNFINASSQCSNSLIGSFEVEDPTRFGVLEIDQESKVTQFIEKPKDKSYGNKISLGLYHLYKKDILSIHKNLEIPCSFERQVFPTLSEAGLLSTYTVYGEMLDVGTLESYISAHIDKGEENWISSNNVQISESAVVKNSVILDNCIIEDNVTISDSIISSNSIIKTGTIINKEIIRKI